MLVRLNVLINRIHFNVMSVKQIKFTLLSLLCIIMHPRPPGRHIGIDS